MPIIRPRCPCCHHWASMPIPGDPNSDKVVLLLSDATKIEIPKDQIDEQNRSKISVMPLGILKDLSLEEIADLFAFLETSKKNALTPANAKSNSPALGGQE